MRNIIICTLLSLMFLTQGSLRAQNEESNPQAKQFYVQIIRPGYVGTVFPLRSIVAPALIPACAALEKNETAVALPVFQTEIEQHPDNLAAQIGYIQASRARWPILLEQYGRQAKAHPTGENKFLLGVVAFYLYAPYHYDSSTKSKNQKAALNHLSATYMLDAYEMTHHPVIAMMLDVVSRFVHARDFNSPDEEMIRRMGSQAIYQVYITAKQNHWQGPQPSTPRLQKTDLALFGFFVRGVSRQLGSLTAIGETTFENGVPHTKVKMVPRKPDDIRGEKYMDTWLTSIQAKIDAML